MEWKIQIECNGLGVAFQVDEDVAQERAATIMRMAHQAFERYQEKHQEE